MGEYSILFVAICRGLRNDVNYLLRQPSISLTGTYGPDRRTALFEAVLRKDLQVVKRMLRCPYVSPSQYINMGDLLGNTPLHRAMMNCDSLPVRKAKKEVESESNDENDSVNLNILHELIQRGSNIDALNLAFRTPLHTAINGVLGPETTLCVKQLLDEGAEVNTKDEYGDSPLHDACRVGDHELIHMLLECGADLDSRNLDWKTPQDLFYENRSPPSKADHEFAAREFSRLKKTSAARRRVGNVPQHINPITDETRSLCAEFPVYFRHQWAGWDKKPDGSSAMSWVRTDLKVAQVLYPNGDDNPWYLDSVVGGQGFLADCQAKFVNKVRDCLQEELQEQEQEVMVGLRPVQPQGGLGIFLKENDLAKSIQRGGWRWINFPANNDFIINNARRPDTNEVDGWKWQFFERSIQVHETNTSYARIRIPHVHGTFLTVLQIPYIDIETEDQVKSGLDQLTTQCERIKKLNQAYYPFTGMHGVQVAQTLDQTSYNISDDSNTDPMTDLHSTENQVIYRWSKRRSDNRKADDDNRSRQEEQLQELQTQQKRERPSWKRHESQMSQSHISQSDSAEIKQASETLEWWERALRFFGLHPREEQQQYQQSTPPVAQADVVDPIKQERAGRRGASAPNAERIRQDPSPKWLMVRQVWLWKLDNNTILTAIPSRQNGMTADTLLETIRQGKLDILQTPEDLIKRIVYDTVTFLDEFKWAGLGEHILDVFDREIAAEMYQEAKFFQQFGQGIWSPAMVNLSIQEAAESIYKVKDIRDELRLIKQVLETQLKVVMDFAEIFWPPHHRYRLKEETGTAKALGETFIRDCGLQAMIARVKEMDEDASATLQGLSNIIQAMQAQASLKEAEASRVMNLIILPFTIVTVIFTPLSFLTSLFAVNVLDFPTNEEGELRLPGTWFYWRIVAGEFISLFIVFVFVYYLYNRQREVSGAGRKSPSFTALARPNDQRPR
ncbi:hypothetical protein B0I35DRAFT_454968 [Stachybotrys elegans]|uniref:Uncharacterized protein n=1 Tax=Stachybotrys elegans TaxID=80388 RepID=A0A8K0WKF0_9HYPO|nr:hypothetical protein B0I35DRAFT_454968 [Stachybotrys elegans]